MSPRTDGGHAKSKTQGPEYLLEACVWLGLGYKAFKVREICLLYQHNHTIISNNSYNNTLILIIRQDRDVLLLVSPIGLLLPFAKNSMYVDGVDVVSIYFDFQMGQCQKKFENNSHNAPITCLVRPGMPTSSKLHKIK